MLEFILALLLGILAGTISGLMPGIHINLVSAMLISLASLPFLTPFFIIIFIVSMSITHSFLDFIPSIYLGAPNEDTSLSVMPGHNLLLKGAGHRAVFFSIIGSFSGAILSLLILPLFFLLPSIYPFLQRIMLWILVWASIFLISKENNSKLWAFIIFILAGFLGIASLNLQLNQPLLPLLSGLFGASSLIYSISSKTKIPEQNIETIKINKSIIKPLALTTIFSPFCAFLPGLGSSQSAILSSSFIKLTQEQFLILMGSINSLIMSLSFFVLYIIDKSRTGSAAAISEITKLTSSNLAYISLTIILSSLICLFLSIKISKIFAKKINKINYSFLSYIILAILAFFVLLFSGFLGLLAFISSTTLGLLAFYIKIRKGHLMGCLLVPTILYYLPI